MNEIWEAIKRLVEKINDIVVRLEKLEGKPEEVVPAPETPVEVVPQVEELEHHES